MAILRNKNATRWDWDRYLCAEGRGPWAPRGISTGDVDAEIEINGWFLVLEGKRSQEDLSTGQRIAMKRRVADGRKVLIVRGDPDEQTIASIEVFGALDPLIIFPAGWADLHELMRCWAAWANFQPRREPRPCPFDWQ